MDLSQQGRPRNVRGAAIPLVAARKTHHQEPAGFSGTALKLLANGYSPIPIAKGTKRPLLKGWSRACEEPLTSDEAAEIGRRHPDAGVAIACGYGGLVAIDVDTNDEDLLKAVQRVLGEGGAPRRGSKGLCSFFRLAEHQQVPSRQFRGLLDVLGSGRSCIIPPSIHPDGMTYIWLTQATLINTPLSLLPLVGGR